MNTLEQWAARHGVSALALNELRTMYDAPPTDATTGEAKVQADLRIAAAQHGCSLWRNNSGAATDDTGRVVRYGLENISKKLNAVFKSPDLIGVGPGGRFMAVEVKEPGWRGPSTDHEHAQANFLRTVEAMGGIGMFCTDVSQYLNRIGRP